LSPTRLVQVALPVRPELTPEERAQMAARQAELAAERERYRVEWEAKQTALRVAREQAVGRAESLLRSLLSQEQLAMFTRERAFVVNGRRDRYRIRAGRQGNVDVVGHDGRIREVLCIHPREDVPNFDTMVAQKLMIEDNEDSFVALANKSRPWDMATVLPAIATMQ